MRSRLTGVAVLAAFIALTAGATAQADSRNPIRGYRVKATAANLEKLALAGFDVTEGRRKDGTVEIYGTSDQIAKVGRDAGIKAALVRKGSSRVRARTAVEQAPLTGSDAPYKVWRRYDSVPGDGREQYTELYDRLDGLSFARKVDLSTSAETITHLGRHIYAVKVAKDADEIGLEEDGRPAVLYNAIQHSREWLAGETCRRTLLYFTSNYGKDREVTRLLDDNQLWFVCVANPDGYEYTFTAGNRLWRKNMADNDGNGIYGESVDGVDPNRNFPRNWGLDDEGSSPDFTSETFRGSGPGSEPETKAMIGLMQRVQFAFQKNDHTAAELLLYPQGFQQYTPTADDSIYSALAGDDRDPAIKTFDPDISAELYITNGDTTDYAYGEEDILSYVPEGTEASDPSLTGFEFEDKESAIELEFRRHLQFSLDLARSAGHPEDPVSHLGNTVEDFYIDAFPYSYGDPQTVQVTAKRNLGTLQLRYRINGGPIVTKPAAQWDGGGRYYQDDAVYYHRVRGQVTGTDVNDTVEVWFTQANGSKRSPSFTYTAVEESTDKVLIMAAEDYNGATTGAEAPFTAPYAGPRYLATYGAALSANGIGYDVYDVDGRGRIAPHPLGVLSHYQMVIWYTGDDYLTREPGQPPGTGTSNLALDEEVAARDFINEGGKLFFTGKNAGRQYAEGFEFKNFGPQPDEVKTAAKWCDAGLPEARDGCIAHTNDFLQYYLGAYTYVGGNGLQGTDPDELFDVEGIADPFTGLSFGFDPVGTGPGNGSNQNWGATFIITSSILDPVTYPTFAGSEKLATWSRGGSAAPYDPFSGAWYMAAGADDVSYKRLGRQIDLTGKSGGNLKFQLSYDLELDYDYTFVEVLDKTTGKWTTVPVPGRTSTDVGLSCPTTGDGSAWHTNHPFLASYQTVTGGGDTCDPTGTDGSWNAANGNSGGWQEWNVDLTPFAGKDIELYISVASDAAVLGLGVFVDDIELAVAGDPVVTGGFEADGDDAGFAVAPPPPGTDSTITGWHRSQGEFEEGPVAGTSDSVYTGFGFEGINDAGKRGQVMGAVLQHLGIAP